MSIKPRKAVDDLPDYKGGRSLDSIKREFGFEKVIKLASNENTLGFSPLAKAALEKVTSFYPDGAAYNLRKRLSEKLGVSIDNLILGNGSFELIFLVALAFLENGEETIGVNPSFGWYRNVTKIMGGTYVTVPVKDFHVDLDAILAAITPKTKIIWLCNPNNPTGTIFTAKELDDFLAKIRDDIIVVLDEAYIAFVSEPNAPDAISLMQKHDNIISLRTFSKLEGLANLRIGYGIAQPELLAYLNKVRMPMNVNGAAQLAALAAIDDEEFKQKTLENIRSERKRYYEAFDRWGVRYTISNTNFVFFDAGTDTKPIVAEILSKTGVLIRSGVDFGHPTTLRISIGSPEENKLVLELLEPYFGGKK